MKESNGWAVNTDREQRTGRAKSALLAASIVVGLGLPGANALAQTVTANCPGDSIQALLNLAPPAIKSGTMIINGTCTEDVLVTLDNARFEGGVGGTVNGTITVDGARRVVFQNLTVTGAGDGIVGTNGADFDVYDTTIISNANQGLIVTNNSHVDANNLTVADSLGLGVEVLLNSSMNLSNSTIRDNGAGGIDVSRSASAFLDVVTVENNTGNGLFVSRHAVVESNGGMTVTGNSAFGVAVGSNSHLALFNSTVENNQEGILIFQSSSAEIGLFGNVQIRGNNVRGINIQDSRLEGGNLIVENHTSEGITASNSGVSLSNSTVINNGGDDFSAFFGSRLSFSGNTIGTLSCDGTVLSRGDLVCP